MINIYIYILNRGPCFFFFFHSVLRFLTIIPTPFAFLCSLIKTGTTGPLLHQLFCVLNRQSTGVFYTTDGQFTAEQGKKIGDLCFYTLCAHKKKQKHQKKPLQSEDNSIINLKFSTKSEFYWKKPWQLYSKQVQICMWESMTPKRPFALSYPQKPAMSRAVLELRISRNPLLSLPEMIHLTTFSKSSRKGEKEVHTQAALFPLKQTQTPLLLYQNQCQERAKENKSLSNPHFLWKTRKPF